MYNAMLRKGYDETPEDAVESMVAVHNFLNEGAWAEIVEWERRFAKGFSRGWQECKRGEEGSKAGVGVDSNDDNVIPPRLMKFMGRPDSRTPKATMLQFMGWIYPEKYGYVGFCFVVLGPLLTLIGVSHPLTAMIGTFSDKLLVVRPGRCDM